MSEYGAVQKIMRCPRCGRLTTETACCFVRGHPMFPQTDEHTLTEPCKVVVVDALADLILDAMAEAVGEVSYTVEGRIREAIAALESAPRAPRPNGRTNQRGATP